MKIVWALAAEQDRSDILDYIADDNVTAAVRLDELFSATADSLRDNPLLGRPGQVEGTRELIAHESFRMVYEVKDDAVWILALVHTARMWPPGRP